MLFPTILIKKRVLSTVSSRVQAETRHLLTANNLRYTMRVRDCNGRAPGDLYEYNVYVTARDYAQAVHVLNEN